MNEPYKEPTTCQKAVDDSGRLCGKPGTMWIGLGAVLCYECGSEAAKVARRAWGIDADV